MHIKTIVGLTVAGALCLSCQSNSYHIEGFARDYRDGDTICMCPESVQQGMVMVSLVENGKFMFTGETDTVAVCRIFAKKTPDHDVTFFLEPDKMTVELSPSPAGNRVSGTKINNEWQQLNDSIRHLGQEAVRTALMPVPDTTAQQLREKTISNLHQQMSDCILSTARRNSDNPLGQYIENNYKAPEFK